jgi:hypothetical protein
MPPLPNEKHEIFAHAIARGNDPLTAFVVLGRTPNPGVAEALASNRAIQERILELIPQYEDQLPRGVAKQIIDRVKAKSWHV